LDGVGEGAVPESLHAKHEFAYEVVVVPKELFWLPGKELEGTVLAPVRKD
jgi:hypothetical protein